MTGILETLALRKSFGGLTAVDSVDFLVEEGELRAIIGPNGAGKSTFFNLLTGVLRPTAGRVLLRGEDITGLPPHAISLRGLGRTLQNSALFPGLTVFENVWLSAQAGQVQKLVVRPSLRRSVERRVVEVLLLLGLEDKQDVPAGDLSHGDQRLLEIAIALGTNPSVLLMDEPTAGLSPKETRDFLELIRGLASARTIVLIEHDMNVVMSLATTITVLHEGRIVAEGKPKDVQANPVVRRIYLGEPAHDDAHG